ncbi:MAG: (2Fe-2S) ferredoxin domain-containing protein, partial [Clostridia bacterium]|nr:(2Fe-2S) ferredoxin domain-containing protein [Clostridia bacterium]
MIKNFEQLKQTSAKYASCLSAKFTGGDGKRHIVLCGGTGCLSSRADEITALFRKLVEEKNLCDKVTVNQVGCFGFCSQGPFVKIYPEDTLYRLVQVEDVEEILEKDIIGGETVDRLLYVDPTTAEKITKQEDIN